MRFTRFSMLLLSLSSVCALALFAAGCGDKDAELSGRKVTITGSTSATGAGFYNVGDTVRINAGTQYGKTFSGWKSETSGVTFENADSAKTYFVMPDFDVTIKAEFETASKYAVTVEGGEVASGDSVYFAGDTVAINAGTAPVGTQFITWSASLPDVTFGNSDSAKTYFIMSASDVTITAEFALVDSRDSKKYKVVTIGNQTWMAQNLNYETDSSLCYDNSADSCNKYGSLYRWTTAMNGAEAVSTNPSGVQGVCPIGWHLPSRAEWTVLALATGGRGEGGENGIAGTNLKSTSGWNDDYEGNSGNGTDMYGFSALPAGRLGNLGTFSNIGDAAFWWAASSDTNSPNAIDNRSVQSGEVRLIDEYSTPVNGFSVRCVLDN